MSNFWLSHPNADILLDNSFSEVLIPAYYSFHKSWLHLFCKVQFEKLKCDDLRDRVLMPRFLQPYGQQGT